MDISDPQRRQRR